MKKQLQKALSLAMAAVMCLGLLPAPSAAAGETVAINETNFPDPVFRAYVETLPGAEDKSFTPQELAEIKEIRCEPYWGKSELFDLTGISYFTELEQLECGDNQLTKLDLSANPKLTKLACGFNKLTELDLSSNPLLTDLNCNVNLLTELNLSNNPLLEQLECGDNRLTQLDLSGNSKLTKLYCGSNQLTELNLSSNPLLEQLACDDNNLTGLNLSSNPLLSGLVCDNNLLTVLGISGNSKLAQINCSRNLLAELDVSANPLLAQLDCSGNLLTELNVSLNPLLTDLYCLDNKLTGLNLSSNPLLSGLVCSCNQLTSLDLSQNPKLYWLDCEQNYLTELDLSANSDLRSYRVRCAKNHRFVSNGSSLSQLVGDNAARILDVTGGNFDNGTVNFTDTSMSYTYDCGQGVTTKIRLYRNDIDYPVVALNETNFPDPAFRLSLSSMYEGRDGVFTVDEIDSIDYLDLFHYGIESPVHDMTGLEFFRELTRLNCNYNALTELDVSHNPKLAELNCDSNRLTELDVSHNPKLVELYCDNNHLTELDVSHNPMLNSLTVDGNHLAALNLGSATKLERAYIQNNKIYAKDGAPLSTLPGFDLNKVSNVQGGSFEDGTIHFTDNAITYTYDTGAKIDGSSCLMDVILVRPFTDVKYADFFSESVMWAVANNITAGMGDGSFGSFTPCNRAQIVTFLWSEAGKPEPKNADNPFTDVKETDWFYKPVLWAVENGITSGMTETEFGPTATCNRAQAMTFLWKAAGQPNASAVLRFTDVPKGAWYEKPVIWAVDNGITFGLSDTLFGATSDCLRSQIVTFMHKASKV